MAGPGGVDVKEFFHLVRGGDPGQGGVGGVHQLAHGTEEAKGQKQHHQRAGKGQLPCEQLPGGQHRRHRYRSVDEPIRQEERGEVHLHHPHHFAVEILGLFL